MTLKTVARFKKLVFRKVLWVVFLLILICVEVVVTSCEATQESGSSDCERPTMKDCPSPELKQLNANDKQEHLIDNKGSVVKESSVAVWTKMLVSVFVISAVLVLFYMLIPYLDYDGGGSIASSRIDPSDQEVDLDCLHN
jgi:ABC-type phosphate transport system permease subunit